MAAKEPDNLKILQNDIQNGVKPLYILHGEESYLRLKMLAKLKTALITGGLDDFNYERLDGRTLTVDTLRIAVESVPAMCEKRLVIVNDYDLYKTDEHTRKLLTELFETMPDYVCLVFVYDALEYKPDKRVKLHAVLSKCAVTVRFDIQEKSVLDRFIKSQFKSYNKTIASSEIAYLTHRCGEFMGTLEGEINKIAMYAKDEQVTSADIDAVSVPVLGAIVFELTDALANGKNADAMNILQELQAQQEEPIAILGAIGKNLRGLYAAKLCSLRSLGDNAVMEITGCKPYPAQLHLRAARRFSAEWCRAAVKACAEADLQLKGGARDRDRVLEWLIATLAFGTQRTQA